MRPKRPFTRTANRRRRKRLVTARKPGNRFRKRTATAHPVFGTPFHSGR